MFEGLKNWGRKFFLGQDSAVWTTVLNIPTFGFNVGRRKLTPALLMELYRGWVFACINARAQDTATIEFKLLKLDKEGEVEDEEKSHELLDLLYGVNENMTKKEVIELWVKHLDIFGEAYWQIEKEGKTITKIIPLVPSGMTPKYDSDGMIVGWKYVEQIGTQKIVKDLDYEEVIYFRDIDPFNPSRGHSILQGIYEWVETEINAGEWNRLFFKNNAVPPVVFTSKTAVQPAGLKRLKESWAQSHKGVEGSHNIGVLPAGVEVVKLFEGMKDMDFANLDVRFQNKILSAFGVPRTRLGITDEVNRANAEATNFVYALRTIKPLMEKLVDTLNEKLVPLFGENLFLDFISPVPEDTTQELEKIKTGLGLAPYMSVNEVRGQQGLPPIEGGDVVMGSFSYQPIGAPKEERGKMRAPASKRMLKRSFDFRKKLAEKVGEDIKSGIKKVFDGFDLEALLHKAFVNRVLPYTQLLEKKIKGVNEKVWGEAKEKLDSLVNENRALSEISRKDLLGGEGEELVELVVDVAKPIYYELFEKEARNALDNLGLAERFVLTERLRKLLDEKLRLLGTSYNQTTIDVIEQVISQGLEEGAGIGQIGDNLKERLVGEIAESRAEMIADTETFRVANLAVREGFKESGVVESVRWYTAEDERVCEFCAPLNGQIISVDSPFFKKGALVRGRDGGALKLDYDDVWGGALHPYCRCYVRPEVIGSSE